MAYQWWKDTAFLSRTIREKIGYVGFGVPRDASYEACFRGILRMLDVQVDMLWIFFVIGFCYGSLLIMWKFQIDRMIT